MRRFRLRRFSLPAKRLEAGDRYHDAVARVRPAGGVPVRHDLRPSAAVSERDRQRPDYNIDYVLAHYHEWRNYFRLSFVDDAGRLRVECGYINDTDRRLTYGLAGKEMCVFLAYSDADLKIGATSGENTAMGPNEDGVFVNETACGPLVAVRAD